MSMKTLVKCMLFLAALAFAKAQDDLTTEDCCCTLTRGFWSNHCGDSACNACDTCPWPNIPNWPNNAPTEDAGVCDFIHAYTDTECLCTGNALEALKESVGLTDWWVQFFSQYTAAVLNVHDCSDCEDLIQPTLSASAVRLADACSGAGKYGVINQTAGTPTNDALKTALDNFNMGNANSGSPGSCDNIPGNNTCCPSSPPPCPEERCEFCHDGVPNGRAYSGRVWDSTEGGASPPRYCLRIDKLGAAGLATFSCESNGAHVTWSTPGDGSIWISGFVHHNQAGGELWHVEAHYHNLVCCVAPGFGNGDGHANDLCLPGTTGTVTVVAPDETTYDFTAQVDGSGNSLIIGDGFRNDDQFNFTATGWFTGGGLSASTKDWIGVMQCIPDDCPEPPVCPEEQDCGCTYTRGYWASPRFISADEREDRDGGTVPGQCFTEEDPDLKSLFGNPYAKNVHDTCDYPLNLGSSLINCEGLTIADLFQGSLPSNVNRKVGNFAKQLYAAVFNLQNNICDCIPPEDLYCDVGAIQALIDDGQQVIASKCTANGKVTFECENDNCHNALKDICVFVRDVLADLPEDTDCTDANPLDLNDALSFFNEGEIGPGHCGDRDDGHRGCCSFCDQSPDKFVENCEGFEAATAGHNADLQGGGHWTPSPGWWDIANFVLLIVIVLFIIIVIIWACASPKSMMRSSASLADALKYN